jgi:hypothetical protein
MQKVVGLPLWTGVDAAGAARPTIETADTEAVANQWGVDQEPELHVGTTLPLVLPPDHGG